MRSAVYAFGAGALTWAGAISAQHADERTGFLEEIVVTAQKREQSLQDVPLSIAAVTDATLARSGVNNLDSMQQLTPSLNIATVGGGSGFVSFAYMRGAGTNILTPDQDPSIAFFLDEVYLNGASGLQFELLDVERVEVLKGPQGTLFGRNASAGAVSIITKRPEAGFNAWVSADAGNYGAWSGQGGLTGSITSDGAWRFRVAGSHRRRDAFSENPIGRDPDYIDNYAARATVEYAGENVNVLITGSHFSADNGQAIQFGASTSDPLRCGGGVVTAAVCASVQPATDYFRRPLETEGFEKQDSKALTARVEWSAPFATLTSISAFRDNDIRRLQDQEGMAVHAFNHGTEEQSEAYSQELRLADNEGRLRWIAGLYYFEGSIERLDTLAFGPVFIAPPLADSVGFYPNAIDTTSLAVFGQGAYDLTPSLTLTLGARWTQDEKESARTVQPAAGQPFSVSLSPSWESFDPVAIVEYRFTPDVLAYASYREGFKSGGFQALPNFADQAAAPFNPEHVTSYELGLKSSWLEGRLTTNLAVFHVDIEDQQISRLPTSVFAVIDNAGTTETNGVDVTVSAFIGSRLRVHWDSTIQEARFKEYDTLVAGVPVSYADNSQLRSPDFATSVVAEYRHPLGTLGSLTLRGEYFYRSEIFFDSANTKLPGTYAPGHDLYNARLIFEPHGGTWDVSLWGKNLEDERYYRNIAISGNDSLGQPGDPLTFGLSLNWRLH